jgi:hypothetical protein
MELLASELPTIAKRSGAALLVSDIHISQPNYRNIFLLTATTREYCRFCCQKRNVKGL